jgi:nitrogen fixation NifU-like protein
LRKSVSEKIPAARNVRGVDGLYQEVLLDHATRPRNRRKLDRATAIGEGNNPFCDDRCTIYLDVAEGVVRDASFEAVCCAILLASASLMTLSLVGKTKEQALTLRERFPALLTAEVSFDVDDLGDLAGVKAWTDRIKCATLPWHDLGKALQEVG